jgi:hypothetical protein
MSCMRNSRHTRYAIWFASSDLVREKLGMSQGTMIGVCAATGAMKRGCSRREM